MVVKQDVSDRMSIAQLSEASGVSIRSVRKYIQIDLLSPPIGKTRYAHYSHHHYAELMEIRSLLARRTPLVDAVAQMKVWRMKSEATRSQQVRPADGSGLFRTVAVENEGMLVLPVTFALGRDVEQVLVYDILAALGKAKKSMRSQSIANDSDEMAGAGRRLPVSHSGAEVRMA